MKNRIYIFDWDDNILHMPTKIKMEKKVNSDIWEPIELSTEEFAIHRDSLDYRIGYDGLSNFRETIPFIKDVKLALKDPKNIGPSFTKFKECLMYANDFAIITARGHTPSVIVTGIYELFNSVFTKEELVLMRGNILLKYKSLTAYFNRQKIYTVSSKEFDDEFGTTEDYPSELKKTMALEHYLVEKINSTKEFDISAKISVGFSDDDKRNVRAIESFIENNLKEILPNLKFVVYDTSNPKEIVKRII